MDMTDSSPFDRGHTAGKRSVMLFGVDVSQIPFRKTVSVSNLSQYEQTPDFPSDVTAGYASDGIHPTEGDRERKKRGVPWTEKEHRLFLTGLHKVGKGDWRGISRNFVKTRTPTQVASHAQKYFLRRTSLHRRRRRSSLFDITTDSMEDEITTENSCPPPVNPNLVLFPVTTPLPSILIPDEKKNENPAIFRPIPTIRSPSPQETEKKLDLNSSPVAKIEPSLLSLKLSSSENPQNSSRHSAFQTMSSSRGSGSGITVP